MAKKPKSQPKTHAEVLEILDAKIAALRERAADPCAEVVLHDADHETWREATRHAVGLQVLKELRRELE